MLKLEDIREILAIPLLGVIPESESVLKASNTGTPVIMDRESIAGQAYKDAVGRFLGDEMPHRFLEPEKKGHLQAPVRREGRVMSWLDYLPRQPQAGATGHRLGRQGAAADRPGA